MEDKIRMSVTVLPIYDPYEKMWYIHLEENTFKKISNEEYEEQYGSLFKARYDVEMKDER